MLTSKDNAVLHAIFDAEMSLDKNPSTTGYKTAATNPLSARQQQQMLEAVHLLNDMTPSPDAVRHSIDIFNNIIDIDSTCASACANRAQALQLLQQSTDVLSQTLRDLFKAIKLSQPTHSLDTLTVEDSQVLASAHTHRGCLLLRASVNPAFRELLRNANPGYQDVSPAELEQLASNDFAIAGRHGSQFARSLAVRTNPYAKLCGSIVREALQKETSEFSVLGCSGA